MDPTLLIAFITTTVLFVAAPGPSVAFATAQGLKHGRRGLFITVAGDGLGTIVHIAVAASSLATLLALSDVILPPLQIAGGVFIVWMGLQSFAAMRNGATFRATAANKVTFWAGLLCLRLEPESNRVFRGAVSGVYLGRSQRLGADLDLRDDLSGTRCPVDHRIRPADNAHGRPCDLTLAQSTCADRDRADGRGPDNDCKRLPGAARHLSPRIRPQHHSARLQPSCTRPEMQLHGHGSHHNQARQLLCHQAPSYAADSEAKHRLQHKQPVRLQKST